MDKSIDQVYRSGVKRGLTKRVLRGLSGFNHEAS